MAAKSVRPLFLCQCFTDRKFELGHFSYICRFFRVCLMDVSMCIFLKQKHQWNLVSSLYVTPGILIESSGCHVNSWEFPVVQYIVISALSLGIVSFRALTLLLCLDVLWSTLTDDSIKMNAALLYYLKINRMRSFI